MAQEPIKLTEEELKQLRENQNSINEIINVLGQLEIEKALIKGKKDSLITKFASVQESNNKLGKTLSEKYGDGSIDLNSGEITPSK